MRDFPPAYVASIQRMSVVLRNARANGAAPRFALPPPEILLAAPLDAMAPRICRNEDASELVPILMRAANGDATCLMLSVALSEAGIQPDRVSLAELGLVHPDGPKGTGDGT